LKEKNLAGIINFQVRKLFEKFLASGAGEAEGKTFVLETDNVEREVHFLQNFFGIYLVDFDERVYFGMYRKMREV
jgi:hypothetical protein